MIARFISNAALLVAALTIIAAAGGHSAPSVPTLRLPAVPVAIQSASDHAWVAVSEVGARRPGGWLYLVRGTTSSRRWLNLVPTGMAVGTKSIWILGTHGRDTKYLNPNRVLRVPTGGGASVSIAVNNPQAVDAGGDALWVLGTLRENSSLRKIDPFTNRIAARTPIEGIAFHGLVAAGRSSVWTTTFAARGAVLTRVASRSSKVERSWRIRGTAAGLALVSGRPFVLVTSPGGRSSYLLELRSSVLRRVASLPFAGDLRLDGRDLWMISQGDTVLRVAVSGRVLERLRAPGVSGIAVGSGHVWAISDVKRSVWDLR